MAIQAITHTKPCHLPGSAGGITGYGQYRVRLSTGSLCAKRDYWRVTVPANFNIKNVFRGFKRVADHLVGKVGEGSVRLTGIYY